MSSIHFYSLTELHNISFHSFGTKYASKIGRKNSLNTKDEWVVGVNIDQLLLDIPANCRCDLRPDEGH